MEDLNEIIRNRMHGKYPTDSQKQKLLEFLESVASVSLHMLTDEELAMLHAIKLVFPQESSEFSF